MYFSLSFMLQKVSIFFWQGMIACRPQVFQTKSLWNNMFFFWFSIGKRPPMNSPELNKKHVEVFKAYRCVRGYFPALKIVSFNWRRSWFPASNVRLFHVICSSVHKSLLQSTPFCKNYGENNLVFRTSIPACKSKHVPCESHLEA